MIVFPFKGWGPRLGFQMYGMLVISADPGLNLDLLIAFKLATFQSLLLYFIFLASHGAHILA